MPLKGPYRPANISGLHQANLHPALTFLVETACSVWQRMESEVGKPDLSRASALSSLCDLQQVA